MISFGETRELIVNERDVTTVVEVINKHRKKSDLKINNCGWEDDPTKWFIKFEANNKKYGMIIAELITLGKIKFKVDSNFKVHLHYEEAH